MTRSRTIALICLAAALLIGVLLLVFRKHVFGRSTAVAAPEPDAAPTLSALLETGSGQAVGKLVPNPEVQQLRDDVLNLTGQLNTLRSMTPASARQAEFRRSGTELQWKYTDETAWQSLGTVGGGGTGPSGPDVVIPVTANGQTQFTVNALEDRTNLFLNGDRLGPGEYTLAPPNLTYTGTVPLDPDDQLVLTY